MSKVRQDPKSQRCLKWLTNKTYPFEQLYTKPQVKDHQEDTGTQRLEQCR